MRVEAIDREAGRPATPAWRDEPARRDAQGHLVLAMVLGALLMAVPPLLDSGGYFRDDMEAQFMPTLTAIGHGLWHGELFPLLTLQTWVGGNLAGEYQYGLFNPVLLALYAVLPAFGTQDTGAAFLAVSLGAILAGGSFSFARALGLDVLLAHVAAVAIAGNSFLAYWFAASWFPGFSSIAFMVWAMAFLIRAHESPMAFLAAGAAVFLTATAGWAHTVIALGAFTAAWLIALWRSSGWRPAIDVALAALFGLACAAVAIGPLMGMVGPSDRPAPILNNGFLVANLRDVLSLSNPLHLAIVPNFGGRPPLIPAPIFHAAWFILPILALADWKRMRWDEPRLLALLAFAGLMVIGTQGPSQLLWMRFPI